MCCSCPSLLQLPKRSCRFAPNPRAVARGSMRPADADVHPHPSASPRRAATRSCPSRAPRARAAQEAAGQSLNNTIQRQKHNSTVDTAARCHRSRATGGGGGGGGRWVSHACLLARGRARARARAADARRHRPARTFGPETGQTALVRGGAQYVVP